MFRFIDCNWMEWRTVEIRDENGEGFDTVQCEDMVFPKQFLRMQPEVRMKAIKEMKYRDGDVLLCSYPKTGTHWVFNIMHFLMIPGPVEEMLMASPKLLDLHPLEEIENLSSPRVIITHLKPDRLPVEHLQTRGKIILVARNPRDTMVSHMYHTQRHDVFNYSKLPWNCFFPTGSYFDYYNCWQKALEEQNKNLNVQSPLYENLIKGNGHWRNRFTFAQDEVFDKVLEEKFKNSIFNTSV
ncbi:sulfotransferase 6B1-like [Mercenaria mercenaria]|uniref:sulfotransferase 6B1-like n=1 Tax=Mercenaria mercenaria TaxID=6596 RepID=UPI00234F76B1|nr:sulfotransferase 6B1-like [Mercenaria mercenaria]